MLDFAEAEVKVTFGTLVYGVVLHPSVFGTFFQAIVGQGFKHAIVVKELAKWSPRGLVRSNPEWSTNIGIAGAIGLHEEADRVVVVNYYFQIGASPGRSIPTVFSFRLRSNFCVV